MDKEQKNTDEFGHTETENDIINERADVIKEHGHNDGDYLFMIKKFAELTDRIRKLEETNG